MAVYRSNAKNAESTSARLFFIAIEISKQGTNAP